MTYKRPIKLCIFCGKALRTGNNKRHQLTKLCRMYQKLPPLNQTKKYILIIQWGSFYLPD